MKEALTKATVLIRAEEMTQHSSDGKESIFRFEFHISLEDVRRYITTLNTDDCWFNVTVDKKTRRVIDATLGRFVQLELVEGRY